MRTFILIVGVAGTIAAVCGALLSVAWLILVGIAALVLALVMGALAAPATRRRS
ncbi:hypothetical protein [Jidongwangia harbinensis]|uniref:hypothetical protein n=1 Tax=Jidongwangia harbinensis TaxID=2878561 RepID=UPI001CD938B0|nr:hypothetical protein [Jidongwangia harbinensis]MCA2219047.1 hypothetical protein [Jidongwangia harbinensis]